VGGWGKGNEISWGRGGETEKNGTQVPTRGNWLGGEIIPFGKADLGCKKGGARSGIVD